MKDLTFDNTLQKILKKLLLVIVGSGLVSNALYIYGLAYYEGYIENLGFEYSFFPVKWEETLLWTYFASREIGASTVSIWTKITGPIVLLILAVVYFIARMWMAINASGSNQNNVDKKSTLFARFLVKCRKSYPRAFKLLYPSVKWFLIMEQSIWAFFASYFVLIVLFFIPLLIFIWVYFPLVGLRYGENIGAKRFEQYQDSLCADDNDYWVKCVMLPTDHLKNRNFPKAVYGRIIVKSGSLVGLITDDGPITMTMPPLFIHKSTINKCYKKKCEVEERTHNKSMQPTAKASADCCVNTLDQ